MRRTQLSENALFQCLFSYGSNQGHIFSTTEKDTDMEVMLYHQLRRVFVYCLLCLFVFYSLNGEGKGGTIRIQTKTNKSDDQAVLNAQRFRVGRQQHGRGSWGTMGRRVSEWQTNWPFSTLHWQLVIRGNYKGLLARNDLILLREVGAKCNYGTLLLRLAEISQEPASSPGQMTKVFSFWSERATCSLQPLLLNSPD